MQWAKLWINWRRHCCKIAAPLFSFLFKHETIYIFHWKNELTEPLFLLSRKVFLPSLCALRKSFSFRSYYSGYAWRIVSFILLWAMELLSSGVSILDMLLPFKDNLCSIMHLRKKKTVGNSPIWTSKDKRLLHLCSGLSFLVYEGKNGTIPYSETEMLKFSFYS